MDSIDKFPELKKELEKLLQTRRNEILSDMLETDDQYNELCLRRSDTSMRLKSPLILLQKDNLLEEYADAVFAQEVYELDAIYGQVFIDAIIAMQKLGMLSKA